MYKVYEGNSPYAFISYAHKDKRRVLPIAESLQLLGYRLWYDGGIKAGAEWPENIATHVDLSHTMIAFLTRRYLESVHCMQELQHARENQKEIVLVLFDESGIPDCLTGYSELLTVDCKKEKLTASAVFELGRDDVLDSVLKHSQTDLEEYAKNNGKARFAMRRARLEKRLFRLAELEEKPELFQKNLRARAVTSLIACVAAISYAFIGPYTMDRLTENYDGVWKLIFLFIIPPIIIFILGRLLYKLVANHSTIDDECMTVFIFAFFISFILSISYVNTADNLFLKILISLGLHIAVAVALFLCSLISPYD